MLLAKRKPYRNQRILRAAEGKACVRCGADDGTVVAAHYQGIGAMRLGKGRGMKPHDFASADLCMRRHAQFDGYEDGNDYERAWEFLLLCMETLARRFGDGVVK